MRVTDFSAKFTIRRIAGRAAFYLKCAREESSILARGQAWAYIDAAKLVAICFRDSHAEAKDAEAKEGK